MNINSYHAHIYYRTPAERAAAEQLRTAIGAQFSLRLGRWHDAPVGPHTAPMFQVAFRAELFATLIPWLMLNRRGLPILLHPNTGRPHDDHVNYPFWFGEVLPLKDEILPPEDDEELDMEPNSQAALTQVPTGLSPR